MLDTRSSPARVMVVDDDTDARSAATLLRSEGYEVERAGGMDEGIRLARRFQPEVAVIDIVMRRGDGWQLGRYLRLFMPACRLIAVSGLDRPATDLRSYNGGFDRHVVKGESPQRLLDAVRGLSAPRGRRPAALHQT